MTKKPKYKYNLIQVYKDQHKSFNRKTLIAKLEKVGISERTFYRHGSILLKSDQDITVDQLIKYAEIFDCSVDQLINRDSKQSKKIKTGLS